MIPTITTFGWVPEFARGFVRDLRPRWAMISVLGGRRGTDVLADFPHLAGYVARGEARPPHARAMDAHMATFARTVRP